MDLSDDFNNQTMMIIIIMGLFVRSRVWAALFCYWCSQSHTVSANKLVKIPRLRKLWTKNMIIYHWLFNDGCLCFSPLFRSAKLSGFRHFLLRLRIQVTWYVWNSSGYEGERDREIDWGRRKKLQSHSKHNHNRSITPAKWFMSRFMPGSLYITQTFSTAYMFFSWKKHTHETSERKKTRVYSRYDLSFKLQNVRARTQTQTIQFFSVWSLCLVSRIQFEYLLFSPIYSSCSKFFVPNASFICYHDIYILHRYCALGFSIRNHKNVFDQTNNQIHRNKQQDYGTIPPHCLR